MRKWPGKLVIDATGAGDPIYDDIVRRYPHIEPFRFTAASKPPLIQKLAVAIEQRQVRWPALSKVEGPALSPAEGPGSWEILTDELKRYEYEIHPGGRISYDAPSGFHDDCVVALALANETRLQGGPQAPMLPLAPAHPLQILRAGPRAPVVPRPTGPNLIAPPSPSGVQPSRACGRSAAGHGGGTRIEQLRCDPVDALAVRSIQR